MINGFHKFGIQKECPDVQVLNQDEEEEFTRLVKEFSSDVSASDSINFDMEVSTSKSLVDVESMA